MKNWKTTLMICILLSLIVSMNTCNEGGDCIFRPDDDDDNDNDDSDLSFKCNEFCKNAFFCDLVPSEDSCYSICMDQLSMEFIECGYQADVVCEEFRECFDEYGDEFTGDDGGLECDYPPPPVEDICPYPDISYYAGEMTSGECVDACEEVEGYGYLAEYDDLCGYCYCCGYEDLF